MSLTIRKFILGPLENNCYLLADDETHQAVIVDPSFKIDTVIQEAAQQGWAITALWLTHAHFDHFAGAAKASASANPPLPVGLHPADLDLWHSHGGADNFGIHIESGPEPQIFFSHGQTLFIGKQEIQVRHTPGHSPGSVIFYSAESHTAICGDLIFKGSVGRTDLDGGDLDTLLTSIHSQILTLPPETRLLSGHGPETTVAHEKTENPFIV
jgi:glyoxylase-like metal-dependent hydrolase (beta-lactamase superfamily II)